MVRWMSGRSQLTANESNRNRFRGFESRPHRSNLFYGSVAQGLEHASHKGGVGGSNLPRAKYSIFDFTLYLTLHYGSKEKMRSDQSCARMHPLQSN